MEAFRFIIQETPLGRSFATRAAELVRRHISVIAIMPDYFPADCFIEAVILGLSDMTFVHIFPNAGESPCEETARAIGITFGSKEPYTTDTLARKSVGRNTVVVFHDWQAQSNEDKTKWILFIKMWADIAHRFSDSGRSLPAFFLVMPATASALSAFKSDVSLSVECFTACPSSLDLRLLCRHILKPSKRSKLAPLWLEHILSEVSGNDVEIACELADRIWDIASIDEGLREYAIRKKWDSEIVKKVKEILDRYEGKRKTVTDNAGEIPPNLWEYWASGLACWTFEHGWKLHSAALQIIGLEREVQHRVWRGQASLLLPLVDELRLRLCQRISEESAHEWPLSPAVSLSEWEREMLQEDPLSCQLGRLECLLKYDRNLFKHSTYVPLVSRLRQVRNQLAHNKCVTFADFEDVVGLAEQHHLTNGIL